jgi:NAD(P)H dehydrogenase (quinone)
MYAITGITGKVGGELARALLARGERVRAVLRDGNKANDWDRLGCEIALADLTNPPALTRAFSGATGVFILPPPVFDPEPGYPEARSVIHSVVEAVANAKPDKLVCLSTIGADAIHDNLLTQRTLMEAALGDLSVPVTMLRPAWFIDNASWDVASALATGVLHSFLQPIDKPWPMVAAKDVGQAAARLLRETWTGVRVIELEGPRRLSPNDLAAAFAHVLGKPVSAVPVPRDSWETLFRSQGMRHPSPRMRMLDGFNEGWIDFQDGGRGALKGQTDAALVIAELASDATVAGAE